MIDTAGLIAGFVRCEAHTFAGARWPKGGEFWRVVGQDRNGVSETVHYGLRDGETLGLVICYPHDGHKPPEFYLRAKIAAAV